MTIWETLPWVVSAISIVDMYLYAKKVSWVWWMTAVNNVIWIVSVAHAREWGYIPSGVIVIGQCIYGWQQWRKDARRPTMLCEHDQTHVPKVMA